MDDLLRIVKREITLDCEEGSGLAQVWSYVERAQQEVCKQHGVSADAACAADSALRRYLWPLIVRQRELIFVCKGATVYDGASPDSAATATAKRFLALDAAGVEAQYPNLIVRATQPAIYRELFGREEGNERVVASANAYRILVELSRAREQGITQFRLSKDLSIDPRSAFHFVNVLDTYGLIVKYATFDNGSNTKLLVLRRFTKESPGSGSGQADPAAHATGDGAADHGSGEITRLVRSRMRQRISDILQAAEGGLMVETDVVDALGLDIWKESHRKYFHRVMRDLNANGFVETVRIRLPDRPQPSSGDGPATDDAGGATAAAAAPAEEGATTSQPKDAQTTALEGHSYRRCVRFIKPFVEQSQTRASQGIPLRAKAAIPGAGPHGVSVADSSDDDGGGGDDDDEDSGDDGVEIDSVKEKVDIKNMLSKPQVAVGMLAALPVDMQVLRIVALAGGHGIVSKAVVFLVGVDYRKVNRSLAILAETPVFNADGSIPGLHTPAEDKARNRKHHLDEKLVVYIDESMGREHRKRYFINPLARALADRLTADYTGHDDDDRPPTAAAAATVAATVGGSNSDDGDDDGNSDAGEQDRAEPALIDGADAALRTIAAGCGSIKDMLEEAKARRAQLGSIIRERAVLRMLEHEPVFAVSQRTAIRCDSVCKQVLEMHANSAVLTPAMVASAQKHRLDKRTFIRTVERMADRGLIWYQTTMVAPDDRRPTDPKCARIAIARSVDPRGTLVSTFISQLRDKRTINGQTYPTVPRIIDSLTAVPRTEGAEARDREIERRTGSNRAKRSRGVPSALDASLTKRARLMLSELGRPADAESGWKQILRWLQHPPQRIGRMIDLLTYLVANLPGQVDDTYVFANCAFRSGYIFSRLPLELFIELCGGVKHLSALVPYIRYGAVVLDPDCDMEIGGEPALDEIRARLATPVEGLPRELLKRLKGYFGRARRHIQLLLSAMQALQLIRPIHSAKDIVALPEPPDARDAFKRIYVDNPKRLSFGFQLIGKARLLTREGYSLVQNAFQLNTPVIADLTGCYLNDTVYDLFAPLGLFRFLGDLEASAREIGKGLRGDHPLFGISSPNHWRRPVILRATQTQVLDRFVDPDTFTTPLDSLDRLQEAAVQAETTLDEARRYYQHAHAHAARAASRRANDTKRHYRIRKRIMLARAAEAQEQAMGAAAGAGTAPESAGEQLEPEQGHQGRRKRRMLWREDEENLVAVCYAVLLHHARMHGHPFFLQSIVELFPGRSHTANPSESIRQHWARMRQDPEWRTRGDNMQRVWAYAFRDAVDGGQLVDSPDMDIFDTKAAVGYYMQLLEHTPLEDLLERYSAEIAADSEKEQHRTSILGCGWPARRAWRNSKTAYVARAMRAKKAEADRLPATMQGGENGYVVSSLNPKWQDMPHVDFGEDAYKDGTRPGRRRDIAYAAMLTTHRSVRSQADYSCPVTTHLASGADSGAGPDTVAYEADQPPHPDTMGAMRPFERVIDGAELASHIEALALGPADEESDAPAIACCGEQGYSRAQCYAELVCLQSAIVNLTLTPDDEYSVETGHRLLAEKQDAATKAFAVLGRNAVVTRLRGMVSATGLGSRLGDTAGGPLQAVVAHETTGTTRIRTRPARPRQHTPLDGPDDGPDGGPDDNAMDVDSDVAASRNDHGEAASGPDTGVADVAEERRVPGRGFSVSDKFLGAITTSLPAGFLAVDCAAVHARTRLSGRLGAAEFGYLCSLLGQGRLWLRPAYDLEHVGGLRGLAGFRRQERVAAVEFDVCAIAAAGLADAEIADSEELPGPEDESADAVGLDPEPLAVALRLVAGVVHALGPLGASAHELVRLFALFGSSYREALAQVPQSVVEALAAEARIAALLRVLAQRESVFVVGSSDVRYVSAATYHQHWVLTAGDAELAPRLGQNLSGTANKTFAWSLLTALLGRIVNNPGISLATLARRYFAPYIPQFELLNCLRVLVALEIVDAETVPVPSDPRYPLHTTYYAPAPGYHRRLDRIARCSAVAEIQPVIPADADLIGHLSTNA